MDPGQIHIRDLGLEAATERESKRVQIYQAPDLNFREDMSRWLVPYKEGIFLDSIRIEAQNTCVRLDPASRSCIISKLRIYWGEEITAYRTNGIVLEDDSIFFPLDDPQIIVEVEGTAPDTFRAYFEIAYLSVTQAMEYAYREWNRSRQENLRLQDQLTQKEQLIQNMENTKVWKAYRKIKKY